MKTIKTILAVVLAAACCTEMAAQGFRREPMPEGRTAQIMDNLIAQGKAVPISPYASSPSIFSNTNHLPAAKLTPHYGVRIAITVAPSKILSRIYGKGGG